MLEFELYFLLALNKNYDEKSMEDFLKTYIIFRGNNTFHLTHISLETILFNLGFGKADTENLQLMSTKALNSSILLYTPILMLVKDIFETKSITKTDKMLINGIIDSVTIKEYGFFQLKEFINGLKIKPVLFKG